MLRRVVSHPLFYLLLLGVCIALILSARSAKGGSWMGVWTSQKQVTPTIYQKKSLIDDSVIGVTMLHLELTNSSAATSISFGQAVSVLEKSDAILANNVMGYLQNASNKRVALTTYVKNLDNIIADGQQVLASMQLERDTASQDYQQCVSDKNAADGQFFQGLSDADGTMMQQGYDDAQKAGTCETSTRIKVNAYQAVITRLQSYTTALTQLSDLLTNNEDAIVANIDLFREDYLERLIEIRNQLGVYTRTTALD